jgi:hypothetical protein
MCHIVNLALLVANWQMTDNIPSLTDGYQGSQGKKAQTKPLPMRLSAASICLAQMMPA